MKKKGQKMQATIFESADYRSEKEKLIRQMNRHSPSFAGKKVMVAISGTTGHKRMESRRKMIVRELEQLEKKREE